MTSETLILERVKNIFSLMASPSLREGEKYRAREERQVYFVD